MPNTTIAIGRITGCPKTSRSPSPVSASSESGARRSPPLGRGRTPCHSSRAEAPNVAALTSNAARGSTAAMIPPAA